MQDAPRSVAPEGSLSGKRGHARLDVSLRVELSGPTERVGGRAYDLSTGGVRVAVSAVRLAKLRAATGENLAAALQRAFGAGFDLRFLDAGLQVEAEIVRLSFPQQEQGDFLLGLCFRRALTSSQWTELGAEGTEAEAPAQVPWTLPSPFDALPLEPKEADAVTMRIFAAGAPADGSLFFAQVSGLGERSITARVADVGIGELTAALGTEPFAFRVATGAESWASRASLVAAQFVDVPGGAIEIAMLTEGVPGRRLRRAFRRRLS